MLTIVLALLLLVLCAAAIAHVLAPLPPSDPMARLRDRKRSLERGADESRGLIRQRDTTIDELQGLLDTMSRVDSALYEERAARIREGIAVLERQIELEVSLLDEYRRADELLEVELETLRVAGGLEDEAARRIDERFAALESIMESNREMERMIAANEEVERLVRPRIAPGSAGPHARELPTDVNDHSPDNDRA
jgi:hypothetical protein